MGGGVETSFDLLFFGVKTSACPLTESNKTARGVPSQTTTNYPPIVLGQSKLLFPNFGGENNRLSPFLGGQDKCQPPIFGGSKQASKPPKVNESQCKRLTARILDVEDGQSSDSADGQECHQLEHLLPVPLQQRHQVLKE